MVTRVDAPRAYVHGKVAAHKSQTALGRPALKKMDLWPGRVVQVAVPVHLSPSLKAGVACVVVGRERRARPVVVAPLFNAPPPS